MQPLSSIRSLPPLPEPATSAADEAQKRKVELMRDARAKAQKKQAAAVRQRAASMSAASAIKVPSAKDQARAQIARIKERIEQLKHMLLMLGGHAAQAVLQELRQLASELKQAVATLKAASSSSPGVSAPAAPRGGDTGGAEGAGAAESTGGTAASGDTGGESGGSGDVHAEGRAAYAEQQSAADAEAAAPVSEDAGGADAEATTEQPAEDAPDVREHGDRPTAQPKDGLQASDRELIESVQEKLKALRKLAEQMARQEKLAAKS